MKISEHPTVKNYMEKKESSPSEFLPDALEAGWLKKTALESGADDSGVFEITRPGIADHQRDLLEVFPDAKSVMSIVCRLNPANIRCVSRAVSDTEFIRGFEAVNKAVHQIASRLRVKGVSALTPSPGFPMDMEKWPGKMWPLSHKPLAVEAGLGRMGLHRLVIHPRFGSFVILGTLLLDREVTEYDQPLDYDPCIDCKLCAAVCPVGAISKDGQFHFANCMTHNYRDRMGGFLNWTENIASSRNRMEYRKKVSDPETVSMWQSLSYGICNKSSYCMAACPAGEEVIGPFLEDRKGYTTSVVKPLQAKTERIYCVPGTDAESHVQKRFPHKHVRLVSNGLRPASARNFLDSLPLVFQRGKSQGLNATYHFTFTGDEDLKATVRIAKGKLDVKEGHEGEPDLALTADSRTWVRFLSKEASLFSALVTRKIRMKGSPRLMKAFAACFPG